MSRLRDYLNLVKFEHSVFALPFALVSALVCAQGLPAWKALAWIVVAMVSARTAAMAFNRIVDRELDARNPRTANREIPTGRISVASASALVIGSAAVFVFAAWELNRLCFYLSFVALAVILGYSYTKQFTALSHVVLGLSLGIAPVGAWIALTGSFAAAPVLLSAAVVFWVAGFDIIYSTLDNQFDRETGLHSLVQAFGIRGGLIIAKAFHLGFVCLIFLFGQFAVMDRAYYAGVALIAALLVYEHAIVSPRDLSKVNQAFFVVNGIVGFVLLAATAVDVAMR